MTRIAFLGVYRVFWLTFFVLLFAFFSMESMVFIKKAFLERNDTFWNIIFLAFFFLFLQFVFATKLSLSKRDYLWASLISIFSLSVSGLIFFVNSFFVRQVIVGIALALLFFSMREYQRLNRSQELSLKGILFVFHFMTLFFFFTFSLAVHINFAIPQIVLMFFYGLVVFLTSLHSFLSVHITEVKRSLQYSLLLAFLFLQLAWFIHFWPFGYLTTGVILLVIYYVLWDLFQSHFEKTLRLQRFFTDIILLIVLVGIVLVSTPWTIVGN